jgi:DNA-directed RNA polymerase specialized sigma24 family protein
MARLADSPGIQARVCWIVRSLGPSDWADDLAQEALIHLWRLEEERPGESEHWYLQGCRFHLQNQLHRGRSVDSRKRVRAQVPNGNESEDENSVLDGLCPAQSCWEEISVNDFIEVIGKGLSGVEQATLRCMAEGLSGRETAKRLGVSHSLANRHRNRIAALALSLGFGPVGAKADTTPIARNASPGEMR